MQNRTAETSSLRLSARIAGVLYLIIIVGGLFAVGYVPAKLIVSGDAAATAHNILANEALYRLGLAVHMIVLWLVLRGVNVSGWEKQASTAREADHNALATVAA